MAAADGAVQLNLYASIATSCITMQQQQLVAEATVALAFQQRNPVRLLQAAGAFKLLDQAVAKVTSLSLMACTGWEAHCHNHMLACVAATKHKPGKTQQGQVWLSQRSLLLLCAGGWWGRPVRRACLHCLATWQHPQSFAGAWAGA